MPTKDEILKIRISKALKKEAKEIADLKGETLAVVVREALRQYLEGEQAKADNKDREKGK